MPTQVYTNPIATQPHWLPLVEQCASARATSKLPKLDSELGPGRWKLKGDKLLILGDAWLRYRLHWKHCDGRHTVIGTFDAPRTRAVQGLEVENEEYRVYLEQIERQEGMPTGVPSLEHLFGPGSYKVDRGGVRKDGNELCIVYWMRDGVSKRIRLGSFVLNWKERPPRARAYKKPKERAVDKVGTLYLGCDALGRKTIRVACANHSQEYIPVAIEYEWIKGEKMPKPVHDKVVQTFSV